jgi:hypothetical protein
LIPCELQGLRIHGLLGMATSNAFLCHIRIRRAHFRRFVSGGVTSTCASRQSAFANNPDRYGCAITGNYQQNSFIAGLLAKASVLMSFVRPAALRPDSKKQIIYLPRGLAPSVSVKLAARRASWGHPENQILPRFLVVIPSNPSSFA